MALDYWRTYDMQDALDRLQEARRAQDAADTARAQAWSAYINARDALDTAREELADAERETVRAAARLAEGESLSAPRTNRDERRAAVAQGMSPRAPWDDDDIPF